MLYLSTKVLQCTSDEETTQFEAAYNLGGATVAFSYQQTENDGGTSW